MKNYDEMYQSVLSKYDEYLEKKRKRIRTIKRTAPVLACFCLTIVLGVGYWDHFKNLPHIPVQPNIIEETTIERPETTTTASTDTNTTVSSLTPSEPASTTAATTNSHTDRMTTTASKQTQTVTTVVTDATEAQTTEQVVKQTETQAPVQQTDSVKYEEFSLDYPYYNTVSDLAGKANQVFSGRVTKISFELLNMITMQPLKDGEDTQWAMICTIYEIEAEKVYAGSPTIVKLRIEGGISSGFEQEQTTLLGSDKIPVMEGAPVLYVGDKYLFALYHADDSEYSSILNPQQSIYAENGSKTGEFSADEIISYYS
jgi:hypothetical protein